MFASANALGCGETRDGLAWLGVSCCDKQHAVLAQAAKMTQLPVSLAGCSRLALSWFVCSGLCNYMQLSHTLFTLIAGLCGCSQRTYETVDWSKFESPLDDLEDEEEEEEEEAEDDE